MTRSVTRAAVLAVLLLGALAGCETPATRPVFTDIRFTSQPKLRLDVARIDIVDEFHPSFRAPNVEHLFPVPPARAAANWAHDRLEATGNMRSARVRITDASVVEVELPRTTGIRGTFTSDQTERYDAVVEVSIDILNERGFAERTVSAKALRSQSVGEGITPNQRDQVWYDMTKDVMAELDRELEKQMRANFTFYVQ